MVWSDNSQLIPRGSGRLGLSYAGTNRHPSSFIPKAIKLYNGNVGRLCQTFELAGFTALSLLCVIMCNQNNIDMFSMCEYMSFPQGSNKVLLNYLLTLFLSRGQYYMAQYIGLCVCQDCRFCPGLLISVSPESA